MLAADAPSWLPWANLSGVLGLASAIALVIVRGFLIPRRTVRDLVESCESRTEQERLRAERAEVREAKWERAYFDLLGVSERTASVSEALVAEREVARFKTEDVAETVKAHVATVLPSAVREGLRALMAPEEEAGKT